MVSGGRRPILIAGGQAGTADSLVFELRRLGRTAVWMDSCESALTAIEEVEFDLVLLIVDRETDWTTCEHLVAAAACPVIVGTSVRAPDGRYRRQAFQAGVRAYMCPPYTRKRLREVIRRVADGERGVELVERSPSHDGEA
jgi:CheY-like chemotaxis protein